MRDPGQPPSPPQSPNPVKAEHHPALTSETGGLPAPGLARPDRLPRPEQPGGRPVPPAPGRALIALLGELAARGLPVTGMCLTRLQGTLTLPGGLAVSYCCGWLAWPSGRPSGRGRPLHTLHNAHDPAGAARRLAGCARGRAGGSARP